MPEKNEYSDFIEQAGFKNVIIQKEKPILLPDNVLKNYLTEKEIEICKTNPAIIRSITVYAEKQTGCRCSGRC